MGAHVRVCELGVGGWVGGSVGAITLFRFTHRRGSLGEQFKYRIEICHRKRSNIDCVKEDGVVKKSVGK